MEKSVRLIYLGRTKKIRVAVRKANEILCDPDFYEQIKGYRKFDHADLSPEEIANQMRDNNHEIIIRISYLSFFLPAFTNSGNKISLSFWNFSSHLPTAVNTVIHETVKAIEILNSGNFKKTQKKRPTAASWVIGAIAEVMVK